MDTYPATSETSPFSATLPPEGTMRVVAEARRAGASNSLADRVTAWTLGGMFVLAACACALLLSGRPLERADLVTVPLLVVAYVFAYRAEFESAAGASVPTLPALIAMLFLAPVQLTPVMLLAAYALDRLLASGEARTALNGWLVRCAGGWHAIGPTLLFAASGLDAPAWSHWRLYATAFVTQVALEAGGAVVRCLGCGVPVRTLVRPLVFSVAVDLLMAPLAVCCLIAAPNRWVALAFVGLPVVLVAVVAGDRREQFDTAVRLGEAVEAAKEEARIDPLTQLGNRRSWREAITSTEALLAADTVQCGAIVVCDLDGLKAINDTCGHDMGDRLITAMARTLRDALPEAAAVARLGGDEFAALVLFPSSEPGIADGLVGRIRRAIDACPALPDGVRLSASVGAAATGPGVGLVHAFLFADDAANDDKRRRREGRSLRPERHAQVIGKFGDRS